MYETKEKTRDEPGSRPDGKEETIHSQDGIQHEYISVHEYPIYCGMVYTMNMLKLCIYFVPWDLLRRNCIKGAIDNIQPLHVALLFSFH